MPPLKSFYRGLTKQKRSTTRCVPSSNSGDLCFFLFRFSCGVSSTRTKNNERSIFQNRLICQYIFLSLYWGFTKHKSSAPRCVPSSSSGDFCFFLFRFSFGVSSTRTKSKERSISKNPLIRLIITSPTRCVPSSSSGDLWFFFFRFSFGVSSTRTKSKKKNNNF